MQFIGSKFNTLKKLCIKNCPISDTGIKAMSEGCPSLVKSKVKRCRGVTRECVWKLRMRRRRLIVSVDIGSMLLAEDEIDERGGLVQPTVLTPKSRISTSSSRTHDVNVICSVRGALLLKSRLENALRFNSNNRTIPN
ncbi:hypothetical protein V6N13_058343 [Hibiscus sabdariffa]|uniref:Uncharacterized protein n=1 Tax=Hibiscus sabdariffa TaxID=183260 RepID=A0ABR2GGE7_9ROSI